MIKTIFESIFAKNTKPLFETANPQADSIQKLNSGHYSNNQAPKTDDAINEFKSRTECAYEVAEISLDDFKYTGPERRKFPRKPGETRSCYSKSNNLTQRPI